MAKIVAVQCSFPEGNRTSQKEIQSLLEKMWPDKKNYIRQFGERSGVDFRDLSIPIDEYENLGDIEKRNKVWIDLALHLQQKNLQLLFEKTGINILDISQIISTSVTGLSIPSLEAKLMNRFPFSENTKRIPIFGLGCLGGVAGINRLNDYLKFRPKEAGLLLATELCSLTFQFQDKSVANLVGTSLFGDGAAALLMVGDEHPLAVDAQFDVLNGESYFYPDTERTMGWDIISSGFQIVLSGDVPKIITTKASKNLSDFLIKYDQKIEDVTFMVSHPGGPKVLEGLIEITQKSSEHFQYSWESLSEHGNMSSVSVLNVMEKTIEKANLKKAELGLMIAMGPAFCSEFLFIRKL